MISEFNDLSDKIDRLAELTASLRRENASLRQSNALLAAENEAFMERLSQALLSTIPPEASADDELDDAEGDEGDEGDDDAVLTTDEAKP